MLHNVKFRSWPQNIIPQQTKLQIPGWAGEKTYETAQPFHCKPFTLAATYGIELKYPFNTEVTVTSQNGTCKFDCANDKEWTSLGLPEIPFKHFADNHYGFTSCLSLETEPGYSVMVMPHPRYFTDRTGEVPLPSCGLIETDWWPKIFFIAFSSPKQKCVFRKDEGFAQLIVVPTDVEYNLTPMTQQEINEKNALDKMISQSAKILASKKWSDALGQSYNNSYKMLSLIAKKYGPKYIFTYLKNLIKQTDEKKKKLTNNRLFKPR